MRTLKNTRLPTNFFSLSTDERIHRTISMLLLAGWILLISSIFYSNLHHDSHTFSSNFKSITQSGPRLFWSLATPASLLLIALNHHFWRRLCPLSAASRLREYLGIKEPYLSPSNRKNLKNWLIRYHFKLQWSLLFFGILFRITHTNHNPFIFAIFTLSTVITAIATGLVLDGKSFCQYLCPMAPVQSILTGNDVLIKNQAYKNDRIGPSSCLEINGLKATNNCSACARTCIDITPKHHYWKSLNKIDYERANYSYPGLVVAFFIAIIVQGEIHTGEGLAYLNTSAYLNPANAAFGSTYFLVYFLILSFGSVASYILFSRLEANFARASRTKQNRASTNSAKNKVRAISRLVAIVSFFTLSPLEPVLGIYGANLTKSVIILLSLLKFRKSVRGSPPSCLGHLEKSK